MILFLVVVLLFALMGVEKVNEKTDYMSIKMTNNVRGIFLCMVFLSHIWTYADFVHPYLDSPYQMFRKVTGQCIVAMFLFYSGYGIMESIKKKGEGYVKNIPVHRFLKVLLSFDCAVGLFLLYQFLAGSHYGIKKIFMLLIGWDSVGNSNWYIFCVLWLYIFTYIAFIVFDSHYKKAVIGIFILSLMYMAIVCKLGKEYWWYDTILCYSWGMLFSLHRIKVEHFINENFRSWLFFILLFSIGFITLYFYKNSSWIIYQIWVLCFVALIVALTMRFVTDNWLLRWVGANLFELYILQRLPMMILKPHLLSDKGLINNYIYVIICIILTVLISVIFQKTIGRLIQRLVKG